MSRHALVIAAIGVAVASPVEAGSSSISSWELAGDEGTVQAWIPRSAVRAAGATASGGREEIGPWLARDRMAHGLVLRSPGGDCEVHPGDPLPDPGGPWLRHAWSVRCPAGADGALTLDATGLLGRTLVQAHVARVHRSLPGGRATSELALTGREPRASIPLPRRGGLQPASTPGPTRPRLPPVHLSFLLALACVRVAPRGDRSALAPHGAAALGLVLGLAVAGGVAPTPARAAAALALAGLALDPLLGSSALARGIPIAITAGAAAAWAGRGEPGAFAAVAGTGLAVAALALLSGRHPVASRWARAGLAGLGVGLACGPVGPGPGAGLLGPVLVLAVLARPAGALAMVRPDAVRQVPAATVLALAIAWSV